MVVEKTGCRVILTGPRRRLTTALMYSPAGGCRPESAVARLLTRKERNPAMILVIVNSDGTLAPQGRSYESFAALETAIRKTPEKFEPNTKYMLIKPSQTITTHPQTRIAFDTAVADFPGAEPRKPRTAKRAPTPGPVSRQRAK